MIKKRKLYSRPKKAFVKQRILEENELLKKYGLKNKREVWRTIEKVDYYRRRAKALAKSSSDEQKVLFEKLQALGLKIDSIAGVLALTIDNLLERRLSTIVAKKGLAETALQARQMITHKKIMIDNKVINSPSYLVRIDEENKITAKTNKSKVKKEIKEDSAENTENAEVAQ